MADSDASQDLVPSISAPVPVGRVVVRSLGGRRVRVGPTAAAVATAMILAATAVPAEVVEPREAALVPVSRAMAGAIPEIPSLDLGSGLGSGLGTFRVDGPMRWSERRDGSVVLDVALRSVRWPDATLSGTWVLRRATEAQVESRRAYVARVPQYPELDPLQRVVDQGEDSGATGYRAIAGDLEGTGELQGLVVAVRLEPGSVLRRGPWGTLDTAFARVQWFREQRPHDPSVDVGASGKGTLAFELSGSRSRSGR